MARLNPRGVGITILLLCSVLALITGFGSTKVVDPSAPRPSIRVVLGIVWFMAQATSLGLLSIASARGFAAVCGLTTVVGIFVMAVGRSGVAGLPAALTFVVPVALIAVASAIWLSYRHRAVAHNQLAWRCFVWLANAGIVYLFAAVPGAAAAQAGALAVSLAACGASALVWSAAVRSMRSVAEISATALSLCSWGAALVVLLLNGVIARSAGLDTPQVVVGPLSLAPYFLAAGLALVGAAVDARGATLGARLAWLRTLGGAAACAVIYKVLMDESGTLAVLLVGILVVYLMSAPKWLAATSVCVLFAGQLVLQTPPVIAVAGAISARVEQRLLIWASRADPPDQLERVADTARLSGATGHVGAARLQFVIGPQVSKDYMTTLVLAQGGWLGAGLVVAGLLLLVAGLYDAARKIESLALGAILTAVLGLLLGNILVSTIWMSGVTPFVGVPLPLLGRGGSHLFALALLLLLCEAASEAAVRGDDRRSTHAT